MADRTARARRWLRRAGWAAALVLVLFGVAATVVHDRLKREYLSPGPAAAPSRIQVAQGASVRAVLARLEGAGRRARARARCCGICGCAASTRASRPEPTRFPRTRAPQRSSRCSIEGKVMLEQLTVVEGSTFADFLDLLAQRAATCSTRSPARPPRR